ncbi:hypothetical protein [Sinomicrobium weinanense]|uniref:Uncharacterized protein n=1 Tax=Sinomicrobium weinanense TaxID=2842200 RepID=A0A926JSM1_9FLAO|nr:hypothetical protein [Sinomicrobium weinanense]MBC9796446.1 hypothetical protein [Sinomicrobium weinanense]MBU3125880.1 hypothetical protein [Sinomicrobium weinanense]
MKTKIQTYRIPDFCLPYLYYRENTGELSAEEEKAIQDFIKTEGVLHVVEVLDLQPYPYPVNDVFNGTNGFTYRLCRVYDVKISVVYACG